MYSKEVIASLSASIEKQRAQNGPTSVQVLPSGVCNAHCIFCPIHSGRVPDEIKRVHAPRLIPGKKFLDVPLYKTFIDDLATLGLTRNILFTGLGDPLVHPQFLEMLQYARHALPDCSLTVVTNGIKLKEMGKDIMASGINELSVSLNAGTRETWATLVQNGHARQFDEIINTLRNLGQMKREGLQKLTITSVINKFNCDEPDALLEIAKDTQANTLGFIRIMKFAFGDHATNSDLLCTPDQFSRFLDTINRLKQICVTPEIILYGTGPDDGSLDTSTSNSIHPCYAGWTFTVLFPDGLIYPCCNCDLVMGSLETTRFQDIWHSKTYETFRKIGAQSPRRGNLPHCDCDECGYFYENREYHYHLTRPLSD